MSSYDTVDEAIIDASPEVVWEALLAEFQGARRWWLPHVTFETVGEPVDRVGGEMQVTVHTRGIDRKGLRLRYIARSRTVEPARHLVFDYVTGGFQGWEEFVLAPLDEGARTHVAVHWRARPNGWVRFLAKAVAMDEEHSRVTRDGLANLAQLTQTATVEQPEGEPQPVP
jgi:uncharacterized protein YndB with AHSA1/START domain